MTSRTYKIEGMHCASCVAIIERALLKTTGVHSANVNIATESASIEFDENIVSESGIAKAVEEVGYRLEKAVEMPDMDMSSPQHNHM